MKLVRLANADHCSVRDQIGTDPVQVAFAGPARALQSIVGWVI